MLKVTEKLYEIFLSRIDLQLDSAIIRANAYLHLHSRGNKLMVNFEQILGVWQEPNTIGSILCNLFLGQQFLEHPNVITTRDSEVIFPIVCIWGGGIGIRRSK